MEGEVVETPQTSEEFYLRYYVGHTGAFGHEFIEFEVRTDGTLRYANDSQYRKERVIRKEVLLNQCVVDQFKQLILESKMLEADDSNWPESNEDGRQELEVIYGNEHIFFATCKINNTAQLVQLKADDYLYELYYLAQDLKTLVFSLINLHFKVKPV